ncbi:hypothetical protein R3P38DRAFT_2956040 [Favolaschia claudopus]|uniref:F-box domain-containing protein n=1 Tax=Favolaschia claudopus TaxID=2862362 RepID=A0AAW0BD67_9AGAR
MAGLLIPDLLSEIMLGLPPSIRQKFYVAQVSQFWRAVALDTPTFWSSFLGATEADSYRLPLVLQRSGSGTLLHIHLRMRDDDWTSKSLLLLLQHASRIETLHIEFYYAIEHLREGVQALLNQNAEFPVLRHLRLEGSDPSSISVSAPQLRSLYLEGHGCTPGFWQNTLPPTLESIRLGEASIDIFLYILGHCPCVQRLVLHASDPWYDEGRGLLATLRSLPIPPALEEFELRIWDQDEDDIALLLKAAFSNVVLHKFTACIINGHYDSAVEALTSALLVGVGPLTVFKFIDSRDVELHSEAGHIRHLQCWNDDSFFDVEQVWRCLSLRYDLHKTVREIRMRPEHWHEYVEVFERFPPALLEGLTLGIQTGWEEFPQIMTEDGDMIEAFKVMRLPGLSKVKFYGSQHTNESQLEIALHALGIIEPPAGRRVVICVEVSSGAEELMTTLQSKLSESSWKICTECVDHNI